MIPFGHHILIAFVISNSIAAHYAPGPNPPKCIPCFLCTLYCEVFCNKNVHISVQYLSLMQNYFSCQIFVFGAKLFKLSNIYVDGKLFPLLNTFCVQTSLYCEIFKNFVCKQLTGSQYKPQTKRTVEKGRLNSKWGIIQNWMTNLFPTIFPFFIESLYCCLLSTLLVSLKSNCLISIFEIVLCLKTSHTRTESHCQIFRSDKHTGAHICTGTQHTAHSTTIQVHTVHRCTSTHRCTLAQAHTADRGTDQYGDGLPSHPWGQTPEIMRSCQTILKDLWIASPTNWIWYEGITYD